jgi:hypothetical protein
LPRMSQEMVIIEDGGRDLGEAAGVKGEEGRV